METFEKAFQRLRNPNYKRGGRDFSKFGKILKEPVLEYLPYYSSAIEHYQSGQLQNALQLIDKTIELSDIQDWKQYAFKANVLEDLKKFKEAIENYETAIDMEEDDVRVYALYHQIGFCYFNTANNNKAAEFYSYAIDLKKQHPNTQYNPDEEGMDMGVWLGLPFKRMYNNRALAYLNIERLEDSLQDCLSAINYDKNYSNPYLVMAAISNKEGREQQAIEILQFAAKLGNQNAIITLQKLGR